VSKVLSDAQGKERVEDILTQQKQLVEALLAANADVHRALADALIERDELVGNEILEVIERALSARVPVGSARAEEHPPIRLRESRS
jgi:ribosomal protein L12E/L44/L45/RPP1/RPP2